MTAARINNWWTCGFTADTKVTMADGKIKAIKDVKEGDWVASFDPVTREMQSSLVVNTWSSVMADALEVDFGDKRMVVAEKQRFYTPKGEFATAPDAEAVLMNDGKQKKFSARKFKGKVKLYDITVQGNHSFYADGFMVHNGGGGGSPPPPPPPPDPVVTAGKLGKPLTVSTNGNVITVPSAPGDAGRVSVSYRGAVSTGYAGTPGVAVIRGTLPITNSPASPTAQVSRAYITDAQTSRTTVCNSLISTSGTLVTTTRNTWVDQLTTLKNQVLEAKRANGKTANKPLGGSYTNWTSNGSSDVVTGYDDVLSDINDLTRYVKKQRNFTAKDTNFINGLCSKIDTGLSNIKNQLDSFISTNPIYGSDTGVYSDTPRYSYYVASGTDVNGKTTYSYAPPNSTATAAVFYKHLDSASGRYYINTSSANAV